MKMLWDELEYYLENPGCSCGANSRIMAQREAEKAFQFLMGLTSEFYTVRSNILSVDPMPTVNKIYQMVAHEERQKIVARSHSAPEVAFLAKGGRSSSTTDLGKQQHFGSCQPHESDQAYRQNQQPLGPDLNKQAAGGRQADV
ncbi:hypothetical protein CRG98_043712 [Punica granatum]|uniref:Uncharacterized protein n=1 Tax=Punica granatum TaxID=22663 RepID=A0A2I0HW24_PUNGR|nr:hypothetical protein CRG98_043712 [Punica granatum]